jgi:hypothetical protein
MTRDDLDELQALAASISEESTGWRERRRHRAITAAQARTEAVLVAPVKRRRKHRWIAAAIVASLVIAGGVVGLFFLPTKTAAPAATPPAPVSRQAPTYVKAGRQGASELSSQGQIPNEFACQRLYGTEQLASVPGQQTAQWQAGYVATCSGSVSADGGTG